jgi:hypothetical protein
MAWEGKMVSLELDDESKLDHPMPIAMASKPDFPYGLRICLCCEQLDKLGLDADCEVGDMLEFRARARVTSVSKSDDAMSGPQSRVELQIEEMELPD